jgi:hypothetical protein
LNDQGFEPIPPEIPLSSMTFVIETGEPLLDILDEFGKRCPPGPKILNAFVADLPSLRKPLL